MGDGEKRETRETRVLVLTSSTGGGHNMRAKALKAWSETPAGREVGLKVTIHQTLEQTHGLYRFGVNLYNRIQQFWPKLHHLYFNFLEHACLHDHPGKIWGADRFVKVIKDLRPDILLSTHAHLNHGFFELARQHGNNPRLKLVTYCGELSGGYGFSRHWVNPRIDLFIGAVEETSAAAADLGMPDARNWVGGFLLDPEFYGPTMDHGQRTRYLREELELDPDRFTVVLSTGANGANNHLRALRSLERAGVYPQVVALCGRKEETISEIHDWLRHRSGFQVRALPYYAKMSQLLQSASCVLARAGTGTTSEAIVSCCPIVLNGIGGVMPQEKITVDYCASKGIARVLHRTHQLPICLNEWMRNEGEYRRVRERIAALRPQREPIGILERLRALGEE